jgi:hypothetical protein
MALAVSRSPSQFVLPKVNTVKTEDYDEWDTETEGELSPIKVAAAPATAAVVTTQDDDMETMEVLDDWDSDECAE